MSIVIEEITTEVVPEPRRSPERAEGRSDPRPPEDLSDRIRAAVVREARRAQRLSDR